MIHIDRLVIADNRMNLNNWVQQNLGDPANIVRYVDQKVGPDNRCVWYSTVYCEVSYTYRIHRPD